MENTEKQTIPHPIRFVWQFAFLYKFQLILTILFGFALSGIDVLIPYIYKLVIDTLSDTPISIIFLQGRIDWILGIYALAVITQWAIGLLEEKYNDQITVSLRGKVQEKLSAHLSKHSARFFQEHQSGSLVNYIGNTAVNVRHLMDNIPHYFFKSSVFMLISIVLLSSIHLFLGVILTVAAILYIIVYLLVSRHREAIWGDYVEKQSKTSGAIADFIGNIFPIKHFAHEKREIELIKEKASYEINSGLIARKGSRQINAKFRLVSIAGNLATFAYAVYLFSNGHITLGDVVLVFSLSSSVINSAHHIGYGIQQSIETISELKVALQTIYKPYEIVDAPSAKSLKVKDGVISIEDVQFSYNDTGIIIDNLTLSVKSSEKIGLVGYSGAGKSTLVNLLLRLYDLQEGSIKIDGQDVSGVTQESLRSHIAVIPQEPLLFHRTIMENILFAKPEATEKEAIEAAKQACADEFIQKLPEGYNSIVGERGTKLSGGERQRIAIARAVLKNAPILVMDEPTSSLDSITENYIKNNLDSLMEGKTVFVIAHRLSTIAHLDRIVVMEKGKIIEQGTHQKLLAKKGRYAEMWNMQSGGFLPVDKT